MIWSTNKLKSTHVLFDCGRRGLALQGFDVGRDRDGLNVFQVLVTGVLTPRKKLLDRPVISGPRVRVADRDREKFEELFAGRWASACDDDGSCERIY